MAALRGLPELVPLRQRALRFCRALGGPGTPAAELQDQVPEPVKSERLGRLQSLIEAQRATKEKLHTQEKQAIQLVADAKRYQDVEELVRAGINVISTLNIQHLESLHVCDRCHSIQLRSY